MRLHRKTLLSVGGSCLSAAGGRRGGRYMWGLRERTHPRSYSACRTLKGHSHSCIYNISASPHLQQLLVLVSTGKGLRASERGQKKRFSTFESKLWSLIYFFCKIHTVWRLCVTDGRHGFQGRFQRKLNIGNHWAEGWRLLCGDLHGKYINAGKKGQKQKRGRHTKDEYTCT